MSVSLVILAFYFALSVREAKGLGNATIVIHDREKEYISFFCIPNLFSCKVPLTVKLLKQGVEEPIVSATFYSWDNETNENISDSARMLDIPCWKEVKILNNCVDYWQQSAKIGSVIFFKIKWIWTLFFVHQGTYICQAVQSEMVKESSQTFSGILHVCC